MYMCYVFVLYGNYEYNLVGCALPVSGVGIYGNLQVLPLPHEYIISERWGRRFGILMTNIAHKLSQTAFPHYLTDQRLPELTPACLLAKS